MIAQGQTGLLFDSGDEAALSEAMNRLLANPDEARRLGEAGREYVRSRFDLRVMAETYEQHYRNLLLKTPSVLRMPQEQLLESQGEFEPLA